MGESVQGGGYPDVNVRTRLVDIYSEHPSLFTFLETRRRLLKHASYDTQPRFSFAGGNTTRNCRATNFDADPGLVCDIAIQIPNYTNSKFCVGSVDVDSQQDVIFRPTIRYDTIIVTINDTCCYNYN